MASRPESTGDATKFQADWHRRFEQFAQRGTDDASVAGWTRAGLAARVSNFERHWVPRPGGELWLDAGCGAGTYVRLLQRAGVKPIGMDYCVTSLLKAREWVPEAQAWCNADVTRLPVRDGSLHGVLCFGVLQALTSPEAAIVELTRAVNDAGEVWVDALNAECLINRWVLWRRRRRGQGMHLRYDAMEDLRGVMQRAGLVDIEVQWIPILPRRLSALQRVAETGCVRGLLQRWPSLSRRVCHAFALRGRRSKDQGMAC